MPDLENVRGVGYLDSAKTIVKVLTHGQKNVVSVVYRRRKRKHVRGRIRGSSRYPDVATEYVWEKVVGVNRVRCKSWQVVQVAANMVHRLPRLLPVWSDDPTDGKNSIVNLHRIGFKGEYVQAPVSLVSMLMGERVTNGCSSSDLPVWYLDEGNFKIVNRRYTLGLIEAKSAIKSKGLKLPEVLKLTPVDWMELTLSKEAIYSLDLLVSHRKSLSAQ